MKTKTDRKRWKYFDPGQSEEANKIRFRRLVMRWHPDKNEGDARAAEIFNEIVEEYDDLDKKQNPVNSWSGAGVTVTRTDQGYEIKITDPGELLKAAALTFLKLVTRQKGHP